MGRWPSQVSTLTDGIKEKVGQAGQVSGKQTPGGRAEETNTSQSQTAQEKGGVWLGCFGSKFSMSKPVCRKNNVHLLISGTFQPWEAGGQGTKAAKSKQSKCPKVEYRFFLVGFAAYLWWHFNKCTWSFLELQFYVAWIVMIHYHPGIKVLHLSGRNPIAGPGHEMFDYQYSALPELWHSISSVHSDLVAMSKPRFTARWPFATGVDCPLSVTHTL